MKKDRTHKVRENMNSKHGLTAKTTTISKIMSFGKDVVNGGITVEGLQLELPPLGDLGLDSNPVSHQIFYLRKLIYLCICKIWMHGH